MEKSNKVSGFKIIITSWNVRGIRKLIKLKQVLNRIKYLKSKIVFLQESHLTRTDMQMLTKRWTGQVFHAPFTSHARGVVTLIHKSVPFQKTKLIIDPGGRFIIVQGNILSQKINLINIYGPNEDSPSFYNKLFLTLSNLEGLYVLGGDFNCTLDPVLDKSSGKDNTHGKTRKLLNDYIRDLRLQDIWRISNPTTKQYSCFSNTFKTSSRIDYFLISTELQCCVDTCWYNSIVLSDHAPVSLTIQLGKLESSSKRWRFQTYLLKDSAFVTFLEKCIDTYFECNKEETSASIRWEAFKAYIRGEVISYTTTQNKKQNQEIMLLEDQIKMLENENSQSSNLETLQKLTIMRAKYDKLTTDKVAKSLMWTKQAFYDQGEKAGKLLAWRIKKQQAERAILSIKTTEDVLVTDPIEINDCFRTFYQTLYQTECNPNEEIQNIFLKDLQFQTLSEEDRKLLNNPLTAQDILEAIGEMNTGKAPGPDGLPIEFYRVFQKKLIQPLLNMFMESFNMGILPNSLRLATITLILKPNKPSTHCASYRGISLMGCDMKILCKILSKRLEKYMPKLIHDDQQGFIIKRQGYHNIRRVLNVLYMKEGSRDTAMLAVDACQAFDRIEWSYLLKLLPRYGLGETFIQWIKLLYTKPTAQILTNNNISKPFHLQRSTRQGCPLSPLLFTLALEPLALAVRAHQGISGVNIGRTNHLISLFADDIIYFLTDLKNSIPNLMTVIKDFGEFSGYKINNTKSMLMLLNKEERENPNINTDFTLANEGFKYLGIKITPDLSKIITANYNPLVDEVTETLNRWSNLPISMIGRIHIIKMSILPKFLYYFQTLPLPLPQSFFDNLNKLFSQFIWNNRKARLRLRLLYLPYERGGLQLPNLKWYYMAAQLTSTSHYFCKNSPPAWVTIEQQSTPDLPIYSYLYSANLKTLKKRTKNPFLRNNIIMWYTAHKLVENSTVFSQFTPLWNNDQFTPGKNDGGFKMWKMKGIHTIKDLYVDGVLLAFRDLSDKYQLPVKHFFKYLQLKSFMSSKMNDIMHVPKLSLLEEIICKKTEKGLLSKFYKLIMTNSKDSAIDRLNAWRKDIQEDIDENEWHGACLKAQKQSINTRLKLLQYKWLTRVYITPEKLNRISKNIPDVCTKCRADKGTLIHCMWECPNIQTFWRDVVKCLSDVFMIRIPLCAKICILGIYPAGLLQNKSRIKLLDFGLLHARRAIALNWKNMDSPSMKQWIKELSECIGLERLTYIAKGRIKEFVQLWEPYMNIITSVK